ncbi:uncharacterized protein SPAPADRAFT_60296 [Spathaspora passalidarum NRRL Y-27907]|uniref:Uncharacterized protein n=1 Tax=Spathaspora passalidarum (strain NRRL Y-27907 / 11-Y1) TaxID=619300 RepID=G3AKR0_SPAPN|nr:uncharacterized protein SPAPADRAFT_60296 [Spathaspora passalidarum NRRL Y-27907]EGW32963.1 hypothetical protein SPAPADRAFT_60296 [Spathaspora passalidarum NRRL Y-27907]
MADNSLADQVEDLIKIVKSTLHLTNYQKHELTKLLTMTMEMIQVSRNQDYAKHSRLVDSYRQLVIQTISPQKHPSRSKRSSMFELHDEHYISNLSPPPSRTTTNTSMYRFPHEQQGLNTPTDESTIHNETGSDSEFDDERSNTVSLAHPRTTRPTIINRKLKHIEPDAHANPFTTSNLARTFNMPVTPHKQQSSATTTPLHSMNSYIRRY